MADKVLSMASAAGRSEIISIRAVLYNIERPLHEIQVIKKLTTFLSFLHAFSRNLVTLKPLDPGSKAYRDDGICFVQNSHKNS